MRTSATLRTQTINGHFAAIPYYLQALLSAASASFASNSDNYALLDAKLKRRFARVVYVSLNYDTLLDGVLNTRRRLERLDDFIAAERWALIKPHGSITWGRQIVQSAEMSGFPSHDPPAEIELTHDIRHVWSTDINALRRDGLNAYYPSISVPLGPEAETLNCPQSHLDWLRAALLAEEALDLLVIGYSGVDLDVLRLFRAAEKSIRSALIVNETGEAGLAALGRVGEALGFGLDNAHQVGPPTFAAALRSTDFDEWISDVAKGRAPQRISRWTRSALGVDS